MANRLRMATRGQPPMDDGDPWMAVIGRSPMANRVANGRPRSVSTCEKPTHYLPTRTSCPTHAPINIRQKSGIAKVPSDIELVLSSYRQIDLCLLRHTVGATVGVARATGIGYSVPDNSARSHECSDNTYGARPRPTSVGYGCFNTDAIGTISRSSGLCSRQCVCRSRVGI